MIYVMHKPKYPLMWKHACCYCGTKWLYDQSEKRYSDGVSWIECPGCHATFEDSGDSRATEEEIADAENKEFLKDAGSYQDR